MANTNVETIICKDCGESFTITADNKKWYEEMGFKLPKRCKNCRKKRRESNGCK